MKIVSKISLGMLLKSKIARKGVELFLILLIASCATWENSPFVGDPETESIFFEKDGIEKEIFCDEPEFINYVCWHVDQIAKLVSLLKKHGIKRKEIKPIEEKIRQVREAKKLYFED